MNSEIRKIDSIKNMAVFQDFCWDDSFKSKDKNVAEFKKINILYGRNYSGKTTLSRIFRALEIPTSISSCNYDTPFKFQLRCADGSKVTQDLDSLNEYKQNEYKQVVRVFNKDFIKDNFLFIVDDKQKIKSFAILGKGNIEINKKIKQHEKELGSLEEKTGLRGKLLDANDAFKAAQKACEDESKKLESLLFDKANNKVTGIKHNKVFGDANYNITKIREDLTEVNKDTYTPLSSKQVDECYNLIKEESKDNIPEFVPFGLKYSNIVPKAKELIERKIHTSDPIQDLLKDADLAQWVKTGRKYHEDKREKCAFCGSEHPSKYWQELWGKLDKHFNKESEELETEIDGILASIESEKKRFPNFLKIENKYFYTKFTQKLNALAEKLSANSKTYCTNLESIKEQLKKRKNDILRPLSFDELASVEDDLNAVQNSYEEIRNESNEFTKSLKNKQSDARNDLRLHEVFTFNTDIKYVDSCKDIEALKKAMDKREESKVIAEKEVSVKEETINKLQTQWNGEKNGIDLINHYLNHIFGHPFLSIAFSEDTSEDVSSGYRFEVIRNGNNKKMASHLSEGECSLIAFCYFMAKLENGETKDKQPIIWIDDPVSSLDSNHIYFVHSLIRDKIVTPQKNEQDRFKQLFISTHNLEFLKYLEHLPDASRNNKYQHFFITQDKRSSDQSSDIVLMPQYLKKYFTEFNFLFHQIYKCANAKIECDQNYDCCYNFGNSARRFLEAFLYYKYPNFKSTDYKMELFFGDDVAASITARITNEGSHLAFNQGIFLKDVPEMKTVAKNILRRIETKDKVQYEAFFESIGEKYQSFL